MTETDPTPEKSRVLKCHWKCKTSSIVLL